VGLDIPANEPLLFYLPFARPALVEDLAAASSEVQVGSVSGATLHLPQTGSLSAGLNSVVAGGAVAIEPGQEFLIDIRHTGSIEIIDLRPILPVRFLPGSQRKHSAH
jgi:hypothetical protein